MSREKIQNNHLKLLWDPANSYRVIKENVPEQYQSWSLSQELETLFSYIGHVHCKDYHYDISYTKPFQHMAIGEGDIDYPMISSILQKKQYTSSISLEPEVNQEQSIKSMQVVQRMI